MGEPIWKPSSERIAAANMTAFRRMVAEHIAPTVGDYAELYDWSVRHPERFWPAMWDFSRVIASRPAERVLVDGDRMPGARWFTGARLNYAENLLRNSGDAEAIVFWNEHGRQAALSFSEVREQAARLAVTLRRWGIAPGDRVAGYLPNLPETVIAMLAATSVGAVWTACAPDFGLQGVLDRFSQTAPRALVTAASYRYHGKEHRLPGPGPRPCRPGTVHRADRRGSLPRHAARSRSPARRGDLGRGAGQGRRAPLRATSLRSPRLHRLFLRNHWPAEVHRPRRRRHAASARQGADAPHRRQAGRPHFLLHHLRLDDVELARQRAGRGRDHHPLRRLAAAPGAGRAVPAGGGRTRHRLRHQRQVPGRNREGGPRATGALRFRAAADRALAPARRSAPESFEYVYRADQGRRLPVIHFGRDGHHLLLRAG